MIKGWIKFNESVSFDHPDQIRVTEEDFLIRRVKLKREKFTDREIKMIKDITDKDNSYLRKCLYKLEPGFVDNTIIFETSCGNFNIEIIKCEDEWYLIKEIVKPSVYKNTFDISGFFIADGFDQLFGYLKWYL